MSKKSDAIFEATRKSIRNHIWRGNKFDSLTCTCYKNGDAPTQRTVNDMMASWHTLAKSIEQDIDFLQRKPTYADGTPRPCDHIAVQVEVARRLYLTIQNEQRRLDASKAYNNGEISLDEYWCIAYPAS